MKISYLREHKLQILLTVSCLYLIGGAIFGYVLFSKAQTTLGAYRLGQESGRTDDGISDLPTVLAGTDKNTKEDLAASKEKRVNIVLLGIDQRDDERRRGDPSRTDTIIFVTLDLTNKTAGLLSVPRDLYVTIPDIRIPGNGPGPQIDRINTAHFWGDWLKYPGGGTELLKKTFAYNFGVPIDYYARIDFRGFEKAIDTLGGVTVNVEKPIYDETYPTDKDSETMEIYFASGKQTLNGRRALQYVRTRHADNDFARNHRQQQVLAALAQQTLKMDALPKLPSLLSILKSSFETDMPLVEMLRLGALFKEIDANDIVTQQIDATMVTETITPGGADVLIPRREKVELAFQDVLYGAMVRRERATVAVLSGVSKSGVASRLAKSLQKHGYDVTTVDDADSKDYRQSEIIYHTNKPYTAATLIKELKTQAPALSIGRDVLDHPNETISSPDNADLTIIVGQDLVNADFN